MDVFENLDVLKEEYAEYARECRWALRLAEAKVINVKEAVEQSTPGEILVFGRIKSFESVVNKCVQRGYDLTIDSIKEHIRDVTGIRVVTVFRDDIYVFADMLRYVSGMVITQRKDYVKEPKPNGYSSLHLVTQVEIYQPMEGPKLVPVEIQIRDAAMDYWAKIEHVVGYKKDNPAPGTTEMFKRLAGTLAQSGREAIELRDFTPNNESADEPTKNPAS